MRKAMRSGFTLIELMVVVVLVMVLALAIVPAFKDMIDKAKYTEGSATISALRTKIKMFYVDNGRLPGVPAAIVTNTAVQGGASWANVSQLPSPYNVTTHLASATASSREIVQILCSRSNDAWLVSATVTNLMTNSTTTTTATNAPSNWQNDLDIDNGEYAGAYFKNNDYQYAAFNAGMRTPGSYGYVMMVAGSGEKKAPPIGTAYGVMEIQNLQWTDSSLTLTFERYKALSVPGSVITTKLFLLPTTPPSSITESPYNVAFPLWGDVVKTPLSSSTGKDPDVAAFGFMGWK